MSDRMTNWLGAASAMLQAATWLSARVPDATVVVSRALGDHYERAYGRSCVYIPNGVSPKTPRPPNLITAKYGLEGHDYALFVGRLVPEKNVDVLIRAFRDVGGNQRLVIAGGSSYTDEYTEHVRRLASEDERVLMTGYVYGEELDERNPPALEMQQDRTHTECREGKGTRNCYGHEKAVNVDPFKQKKNRQ